MRQNLLSARNDEKCCNTYKNRGWYEKRTKCDTGQIEGHVALHLVIRCDEVVRLSVSTVYTDVYSLIGIDNFNRCFRWNTFHKLIDFYFTFTFNPRYKALTEGWRSDRRETRDRKEESWSEAQRGFALNSKILDNVERLLLDFQNVALWRFIFHKWPWFVFK